MAHRSRPRIVFLWDAMEVRRVSRHKVLSMLCLLLAWAFGSFGHSGVGFAATVTDAAVPALRFLGDPELMRPQPEVSEVGAEVQGRLRILKEAMSKYGGIGIAAPQIGWWVRAMCFGIEDGNPRYPAAPPVAFQYWINPETCTCK